MKTPEWMTREFIVRSAIVAFFAFLLFITWAVTRLELFPNGDIYTTTPHVISGDEPHHLLVIDSILFDHDLELQDDYERVKDQGVGGIKLPDHHTIIVNRRTGRHGTWVDDHNDPELAPGPDVYEVSSHPIAYPALLAALIFPFHPKMENVQRDVGLVMVLICWLGAIFTFLLARKVGLGRGEAVLAAALLGLASPWLAYSRSFYSEPVIGLTAIIALYGLEAGRPLLAGAGAAAAAIFKPPFAFVGGGFLIDRIQRKQWHELIQIVLVLAPAGLVLVSFNYWLARTPIISGNGTGPWPFGSNTASNFFQLGDTFIGSEHGLFIWAPWTIFAIFPIGLAFCSMKNSPSFLREMSLPMAMQLAILAASDFGPNDCYGPRYWVPFLPWMAVAAVYTFRSTGWTWKTIFIPLAIASFFFSIVGALRYPQLFGLSPWYILHMR